MKVTFFPTYTAVPGVTRDTTLERLLQWLSRHVEAEDKYAVPCWSPASFVGGARSLANVEHVSMLVLDVDRSRLQSISDALYSGPWWALVHSTWSAGDPMMSWRIVMQLTRSMNREEHAVVWRFVANELAVRGIVVDRACSDASRLYFGPSHPPGRRSFVCEWPGEPIDVDNILRCRPTPEPEPDLPPREPTSSVTTLERARRYLETIPGAISGQGGHRATFHVAQILTRGLELPHDDALALIAEWNKTCLPPWRSNDLQHKLRSALQVGTMRPGSLLLAPRSR